MPLFWYCAWSLDTYVSVYKDATTTSNQLRALITVRSFHAMLYQPLQILYSAIAASLFLKRVPVPLRTSPLVHDSV